MQAGTFSLSALGSEWRKLAIIDSIQSISAAAVCVNGKQDILGNELGLGGYNNRISTHRSNV